VTSRKPILLKVATHPQCQHFLVIYYHVFPFPSFVREPKLPTWHSGLRRRACLPDQCQFLPVGSYIWTVDWQTPAVGTSVLQFPTKFRPTLIHHLARPPPWEQDALATIDSHHLRDPRHNDWMAADSAKGRVDAGNQFLVFCVRSELENGRTNGAGTDFDYSEHGNKAMCWNFLLFHTPDWTITMLDLLPSR